MKKNNFKQNLSELPTQPDFIFIITDQERATQHFPDNWEKENLPTLTFLKENGFSFERAFCNTCMCSPSRSTLFTGTYPAQHQVIETLTSGGIFSPVEPQLNNQTPNIGRILDGIGYDVQYRGKWHLSKGADGGDPLAKDIALFGFKGWVGPDAGEDAKPENFGGGFANHDAMYIEQAIQYLEQVKVRRKNGDTQPYCLVLSLVNPHDVLGYPNSIQYGYNESDYTGRDIPNLPTTVNENLIENAKPIAQFQTNIAADGLLGVLKNDDMKLNYLNFYAFLLKKIDGEIGKVIDVIYDKDEVVGKSNIRPLRYYSADFQVKFSPTVSDKQYDKSIEWFKMGYDDKKDFFESLGLFYDKKLSVGLIPVAELNRINSGFIDMTDFEIISSLGDFDTIFKTKIKE